MLAMEFVQQPQSWRAQLRLNFENKLGKTCLVEKSHRGPLMVQKPFYPESPLCCHTYLIHPPGGIAGGDHLEIDATIQANSHALITTPAATKFYRSVGPQARQTQTIRVGENAILEWLPQETVYFSQAKVFNKTVIKLHEESAMMAWEIQCLGLTAQQQHFDEGQCFQKLEIWQNKQPLLLETNRFKGGDAFLQSPCGLDNHKTLATFVIKDPKQVLTKALIMDHCPKDGSIVSSCTYFNDLYIIRAMGLYAEETKNYFIDIWQTIRPLIINQSPCVPRIWNT